MLNSKIKNIMEIDELPPCTPPDDVNLFNQIRGNYQSDNEKRFFEELEYKEENEASFAYDWLLESEENEDGIYLYRVGNSEYAVNRIVDGKYGDEWHFDSLAEILNINLKEKGYLNRSITLWQWLRERDYAGIRYDRDGDWD